MPRRSRRWCRAPTGLSKRQPQRQTRAGAAVPASKKIPSTRDEHGRGTPTPPLGPGAQAVRLSFWFVVLVALLAAGVWATSNIRRIPADSRAVVLRFGAFVRTQDAGLLIAWPQPFETMLLVPGSARVLEQRIQSLERDPRARAVDPAAAADSSQPQPQQLPCRATPVRGLSGLTGRRLTTRARRCPMRWPAPVTC